MSPMLGSPSRVGLPATRIHRPERSAGPTGPFVRVLRWILWVVVGPLRPILVRSPSRILCHVRRAEAGLPDLSEEELRARAQDLGRRMRYEGFKIHLAGAVFAIVRELAGRRLGMRHFETQLMGGWVILQGMVAEMETGEGKTLAATLPAAAAALSGIPVHVITVNDYLTRRDAELMAGVYEALGLTVGHVVRAQTSAQRRKMYDADVVYCTNKEVTFDYLRDIITLGQASHPLRLQSELLYESRPRSRKLLLRGLHFAIVDEADSILVDESRTPLVISGPPGGPDGASGVSSQRHSRDAEQRFKIQAMEVAAALVEGDHYVIETDPRHVVLTPEGEQEIQERTRDMGPLWKGVVRRNGFVTTALEAIHLYHRDEKYVVRDGQVLIVDEFTGRALAGRSWGRGLHQFVEIKEGLHLDPEERKAAGYNVEDLELDARSEGTDVSSPPRMSDENETLARMSYQRFFQRYLHLSGMTGTAREIEGELWMVYGILAYRLPTNRPLRRYEYPDRIHQTLDAKWEDVADQVARIHESQRPVLVGTRTIVDSERVGRLLADRGLDCRVLNAKQDAREAAIVARGGERGAITVATNMAGRGTDIKLEEGVEKLGGLHVVITERHEAGRIDRQLAGRCARQGDPGSFQAILSMEDGVLGTAGGGIRGWLARSWARPGSRFWRWLARRSILAAQKNLEARHARIRWNLLKADESRGSVLSFTGKTE